MTTIFSHLELETTAPVFPYFLLWVVLCLITKLSSNVTKTHLQSDNLRFLNLKSHNLFHWSKSPSDEINLELCPTVELLITFGKRMSASSQTLQFSNLICTRVLMTDVMKREQKVFRKPVAKWEHFPDQCHWPEFHLQSQKNLEQLLEKPRNPIPGRTSGSYQVVVSKNGSHEQQAVIRIWSEGGNKEELFTPAEHSLQHLVSSPSGLQYCVSRRDDREELWTALHWQREKGLWGSQFFHLLSSPN